jgi:hypothetical protein
MKKADGHIRFCKTFTMQEIYSGFKGEQGGVLLPRRICIAPSCDMPDVIGLVGFHACTGPEPLDRNLFHKNHCRGIL